MLGENYKLGDSQVDKVMLGSDEVWPIYYDSTLSYVTHDTLIATDTSFTFPSINIGTANAKRKLVIVGNFYHATNNTTPSTCTVDGISATLVTAQQNFDVTVGVWVIDYPVGTTADIIIGGLIADATEATIHVYELYSPSAIAKEIDWVQGGTVATLETEMNVLNGNTILAIAFMKTTSDRTYTWTNLAKDTNINTNDMSLSSSHSDIVADNPAYLVKFNTGITTKYTSLIAISWGV